MCEYAEKGKNDIILVADKGKCCGCGACALVCPVHAISMDEEELGCLYPVINHEICIKCGKCEKICSYKTDVVGRSNPQKTYVAATKKKDSLQYSASGGVFAAIADAFLKKSGVVFGCSMENVDGVLTPVHIGIQEDDELIKLQGSKYVQSDLTTTYQEVKKLLSQEKQVLFSGTPCQVAGLKAYLVNQDISRLYTIDIICHGVPSKKLFQDYINELSKHWGKRVVDFSFRDKTFGWGAASKVGYVSKVGCDSKAGYVTRMIPSELSSYYSLFLASEICRESCYSCQYATSERVGDITIGDFWCVEEEHPEYMAHQGGSFNTSEGISCLMVNTDYGKELVKEFGELLELKESQYARVAKWNKQLCKPSECTQKRKQLIQIYRLKGWSGIEKQFRKDLGVRYYVRKIRNWVKMR